MTPPSTLVKYRAMQTSPPPSQFKATMDADITFFLTAFSLILLSLFLLNKSKSSKSINLPPGPPKLPIIGNLHQVAGELPQHAFFKLSKTYGPIMHLKLGQISAIIISSPSLAKDVLKTNDIALASRPPSLMDEILFYGGSIFLGQYGEYWRQMKKLITVEVLSAKKVQSWGGYRAYEVDQFIEFFRSKSGEPVAIREKLTELFNNIICKSSFGDNCKQKHILLEMLDEIAVLFNGFHVAELFPEFGFLSVLSGMKSKMTKIHKSLDKVLNEILEERMIKRQQGEKFGDDVLDVLLDTKENGGLQFPITDNNIKAVLLNLFAGGTDTSSSTIEWAMTELMRNPNVMEKAQKEVREAFKGKKCISEPELQNLVYLKYIIKETLRLHPPVPLLVPRECREHCQIGGYDIPIKTTVMVSAYACAIDPEYWNDPKSFKPERYYETSVDFMGTNFEFIPFGSGRRLCPGIGFGMVSVEFVLAQMLFFFDWQLPYGLEPKDIDMSENEGGLASKKVSLIVTPTLSSASFGD